MDETFADAAEEADYQAASKRFVAPAAGQQRQKLFFLGISVAAFVAFQYSASGTTSPLQLGLIVGVLFVHELGHALGMLASGYRDVRVFFIPLLGAATSGKARGAASWKQGVVLLLGPLPGVVAGLAIALAQPHGPYWLRLLAWTLVIINALNLLPIEPLDGGRFWQVILFSRSRYSELVFRALTAGAALVAALYWHQWVLGVFVYLMLITLPQQARVLREAKALRALELPTDPNALTDPQRRAVYRAMWRTLPAGWHRRWRGKPQPQANVMEQVLDRASRRPPSLVASLGLLVAWAGGGALAVYAAWALGHAEPIAAIAPQRYTSAEGHFSVELCGQARELDGKSVVEVRVDGCDEMVAWAPAPDAHAWLAASYAKLAKQPAPATDAELAATPISVPMSRPATVYLRVANGRGYVLGGYAPDAAALTRMIDSFTPLP